MTAVLGVDYGDPEHWPGDVGALIESDPLGRLRSLLTDCATAAVAKTVLALGVTFGFDADSIAAMIESIDVDEAVSAFLDDLGRE